MRYDLDPEDYRSLLEWLDDETGDRTVPAQAVKGLQNLHAAVQRKLLAAAARGEARSNRLQAKIDRDKERRHQDAEAGKFTESGIDGALLARALCACIRDNLPAKGNLSSAEVMPLLFIVYANWLVSGGERAVIEHPKAFGRKDGSPIGPWFWAADNAMKGVWNGGTSDKAALGEKSPGLLRLVKNVAAKYAPYIASRSMGAVAAAIIKSEPFRECLPANNGGKWGKELSDASIWRWKKESS